MSTDDTDPAITPRPTTPAQDARPPHSPEPTGDDRYRDPLLDYIGEEVCVEWCGREAMGVVVDIDLAHGPRRFEERLVVETGGATLTVAADNLIE